MSHRYHRGWGRFTLYKITTVSQTYRCRQCTNIAVLVAACSRHPSTRQIHGPPVVGKAIHYARGSSPGVKASQIRISSDARPCSVLMCPAIEPSTISSLQTTQVPSPPHNPCTALVPSVTPVQKVPLPTSVTRMPPLTVSHSPSMGGRPYQQSSRYLSAGPPYRNKPTKVLVTDNCHLA